MTAADYADKKQRISTGLGSLLPAQNVIQYPMPEEFFGTSENEAEAIKRGHLFGESKKRQKRA